MWRLKPASGVEMFAVLAMSNGAFIFLGLFLLDITTFEFWLLVGFPIALAAFGTWLHLESLRQRREREATKERAKPGSDLG